jgi:hypothetical protein
MNNEPDESTSSYRLEEEMQQGQMFAEQGEVIYVARDFVPTPNSGKRFNPERLVIFAVGFMLGLVTFAPNVMMSDAGTAEANRNANIGITASLLFVVGGIVGAILHTWIALLPAAILQVIALALLPW